jgi:NPCBM/NEW2 domain
MANRTLRGFLMPVRVVLFALLIGAATATGAELKTLKGETFKGDVVSVSAKEIVLDLPGEGKKTFLISQIVGVDYAAAPPKVALDTKYSDVELVDGTILHCTSVALTKAEVTAKLLGADLEVKLPLRTIANVLRDGQDEKRRKEWNERLAKKRTHDALVVNNDETVGEIACTILDADDKGNLIFKLKSAKEGDANLSRPLANFAGVIFQRDIDPNAPPVVCKLLDAGRNHLMVAAVESKEDGLHAKTAAGVTLIYKPEQLVRLDYSTGNLAYLSDLTPSRVVETSTEERIEHYRKDRNMDDQPIRINNATYAKGLALHSTTALEYNLKGEYRTFQAMAGIDDHVGGHNRPVVLKIYLDNPNDDKPNFTLTFSRKDPRDKWFKPISLNIKDVQVMRIVVTTSDFLDLGLHLDLADARVIK